MFCYEITYDIFQKLLSMEFRPIKYERPIIRLTVKLIKAKLININLIIVNLCMINCLKFTI